MSSRQLKQLFLLALCEAWGLSIHQLPGYASSLSTALHTNVRSAMAEAIFYHYWQWEPSSVETVIPVAGATVGLGTLCPFITVRPFITLCPFITVLWVLFALSSFLMLEYQGVTKFQEANYFFSNIPDFHLKCLKKTKQVCCKLWIKAKQESPNAQQCLNDIPGLTKALEIKIIVWVPLFD
eukprot:3413718-Rhodomonas_salina.1